MIQKPLTMCFSAAASFTASALLATSGSLASLRAKPAERLFTAIPFLFGFQQALEGLQWLAVSRGTPSTWLGYGYLFFAFFLWPTYIPLATYMMEPNKNRKHFLKYFLLAGVCGTTYICLVLFFHPLMVQMVHHHLDYVIFIPGEWIGMAAYVIVVCGSCLLSSFPFVRVFGITMFITSLVSWFWYQTTFTSVWCFFAAVLSMLIVLHTVFRKQPVARKK